MVTGERCGVDGAEGMGVETVDAAGVGGREEALEGERDRERMALWKMSYGDGRCRSFDVCGPGMGMRIERVGVEASLSGSTDMLCE